MPQDATRDHIERLACGPDDVARALGDRDDHTLGTRPADGAWSAREIVCHLRDVEELFQLRLHTILALDEPSILVFGASAVALAAWRIADRYDHPLNPERWAEDRQYARHDTRHALAAFTRRRAAVVALLQSLTSTDWDRIGIHPRQGRLSMRDWVAGFVGHDANHLDQLRRAVDGRP